MTRQARFEIVRTNAGWHARFRASNGRVVWTTEVYTREAAAKRAVFLFVDFIARGSAFWESPRWIQQRHLGTVIGEFYVDFLDERKGDPS